MNLKPKVEKQYDLTLEGIEKDIYDIMFRATQITIQKLLKDEGDDTDFQLRPKKKTDDPIKNPFICNLFHWYITIHCRWYANSER